MGFVAKWTADVHYLTPILLFLCYSVSSVASTFNIRGSPKGQSTDRRRRPVLILSTLVTVTFITEIGVCVGRAVDQRPWMGSEDYNCYVLGSLLVWLVIASGLLDSEQPSWYRFYSSWTLALLAELSLIPAESTNRTLRNSYSVGVLTIHCVRILLIAASIIIVFIPQEKSGAGDHKDEEQQPLLTSIDGDESTTEEATEQSQNGTAYGATNGNANGVTNGEASADKDKKEKTDKKKEAEDPDKKKERELREKLAERIGADGNWWTYIKGFSVFIPMVWPTRQPKLFINVGSVFIIILSDRVFKVAGPLLLGMITNDLTRLDHIVWRDAGLYIVTSWVRNLLPSLRSYVWLPVENYAYYQMSTVAYAHVMSLSMDFHEDKSSGDTYGALSHGRSVNELLENILFEIAPMVMDLIIACGFLYYLFGAYMALNVAVMVVTYMWASTRFHDRRKKSRRAWRDASMAEFRMAWETLSSWTTVVSFNRLGHENQRFARLTDDFLSADVIYSNISRIITLIQKIVYTFGLVIASSIAIYQVLYKHKDVGSFVILLTYWAQLFAPLDFFSRFHRRVQSMMLDAEKLLDLLKKEPSIKDAPDAKELKVGEGAVKFENVTFGYDERKPILKNVCIEAKGGSTTALVGETGGGKTTMLKMISRLYDPQSGKVTIDGQDISKTTQLSLRATIGIVPQEPVMFNESISMNVMYARADSTVEECIAACKKASVHDQIETFPDKYDSKVGERGVKLSGGEKQRIAIARAIIKSPKILLLDEATSAVDTDTERNIQEALAELSQDTTTFVIAHRLSTIVNADNIVVISNGEVAEQGSHDDLFEAKGKYHDLWQKQFVPLKNKKGKTGKTPPPAFLNDMEENAKIQEQIRRTMEEVAQKQKDAEEAEKNKAETAGKAETTGQDIPGRSQQRSQSKNDSTALSWKPDAPEFVPRSLRNQSGNVTTTGSSNASRPGSSGVASSLPKEELATALESVKNARKAQKAKSRADRKSVEERAGKGKETQAKIGGKENRTEAPEMETSKGGDGAVDVSDQP